LTIKFTQHTQLTRTSSPKPVNLRRLLAICL
jgi:hypothetical protein